MGLAVSMGGVLYGYIAFRKIGYVMPLVGAVRILWNRTGFLFQAAKDDGGVCTFAYPQVSRH